MGYSLRRHMQIDYLGLQGKLNGRQEELFRGLAYPRIFHGRHSHHCCRVYGIITVGDTAYMECRVPVGQGIKPCMVAKRAFPYKILVCVYIAFDHYISIFRHPQLIADAFHHFHSFLSQETCQDIFIHTLWQRGRSGIGIDRISSQHYRYRHLFTFLFPCLIMVCTRFMPVPVHSCCPAIHHLHPVHACIHFTAYRMPGMHYRQCYKASAIMGPAFQRRQDAQVGIFDNILLAHTFSPDLFWHIRSQLCESG